MGSAFWRKEKNRMTPRQRRNHLEALGKAASAPRKSWLGKCILLTGIQSGGLNPCSLYGARVWEEKLHPVCCEVMHAGMLLKDGFGQIRR